MNTNIPPQANPAYDGGKPAPAEYQDGYEHQQTPYTNEMQEKRPLHPATQGGEFQGSQLQDIHDPTGFHSERDEAGYNTNLDPNMNAVESEQRHIPPNQTSVPWNTDQETAGYDAEPAPTSYQQDGYGNQPQTSRTRDLPERPPTHPSTRGAPFRGNQFNQPAATGFQPEQDQAFAGTDRNAVDAQHIPPNYDSHAGAMYQEPGYPTENARTGGPAFNEGRPGNFATDTGFGGNRNASVAGNRMGDQYDQQRSTTGTTGGSWRTDPVRKFTSYLSHPSVTTTVNQVLSGGPFSSSQHTSLEPTSREARHLKTSGKMEEMVGKMFGSESLQRRGQGKVSLGRNVAMQVQDLKQAGKLEAKATKLRGKGGGMGGMGGMGGGPTEQYARGPPAGEQDMQGPSVQEGQAFQRY